MINLISSSSSSLRRRFTFFLFLYLFITASAYTTAIIISSNTQLRHGTATTSNKWVSAATATAPDEARELKRRHTTQRSWSWYFHVFFFFFFSLFFNTQHGARKGFESVSVRLSFSPFPIFFYNAHFNREQTRPSCKGAFPIFFFYE